jgi:hypothetical protein
MSFVAVLSPNRIDFYEIALLGQVLLFAVQSIYFFRFFVFQFYYELVVSFSVLIHKSPEIRETRHGHHGISDSKKSPDPVCLLQSLEIVVPYRPLRSTGCGHARIFHLPPMCF